jgi:hypothetical protein
MGEFEHIQMSNKSGEGVADVKTTACELLLKNKQRVEVN